MYLNSLVVGLKTHKVFELAVVLIVSTKQTSPQHDPRGGKLVDDGKGKPNFKGEIKPASIAASKLWPLRSFRSQDKTKPGRGEMSKTDVRAEGLLLVEEIWNWRWDLAKL